MRRLIFAESGVVNPITQLCLLNSIANRHRTVSPWAAAGRLFTVRTVIRRSYALVVGFTPKRYYPACRACIGSLPITSLSQFGPGPLLVEPDIGNGALGAPAAVAAKARQGLNTIIPH